jgi:hypothetical protein
MHEALTAPVITQTYDPPAQGQLSDMIENTGSFLAARADLKPLHWFHVVAMGDYFNMKTVATTSTRPRNEHNGPIPTSAFLESLPREDFQQFYQHHIEKHKEEDPTILAIPLPYEV